MLNVFKHIKLPPSTVQTLSVRHKQVFTRQPREPHFWGKKMLVVLKPNYPKPFDRDFPQHLRCRLPFETERCQKEENPYERIIANEIKEELLKSKMILIIHQNPMIGYYFYKSVVAFKKEGMKLFRNSKQTVSMAVEGTRLASIIRLFESRTLILSSPEVNVHLAYTLLKKMPYYIVLAGVVEDKFVNRKILDEYAKLPDLTAARTQIAHTLNLPGTYLAHNINLYGESLEPKSKE